MGGVTGSIPVVPTIILRFEAFRLRHGRFEREEFGLGRRKSRRAGPCETPDGGERMTLDPHRSKGDRHGADLR